MELPESPQGAPVPAPTVGSPLPASPSASQRRSALNQLQKHRRRRGFLLGLLVGQVLIIALDLGGGLLLRANPHVKLQAPFGVPSIVFLGMSAGAAVLIVAIAVIYAAMALRALFGTRVAAAAGSGIRRIFLTVIAMSVTIGVIIGTAWFMIPADEWAPTIGFAREKGVEAVDASKAKARLLFRGKSAAP